MNLLTYFLGFPDPLTSSLPLIIVMGLILHSLGFLNPFASSLSLIIFAGLLTIIPAIPAYWVLLYYFLFPLFFILLGFFCHQAFCQKWASTFNRPISYIFLSLIKFLSLFKKRKEKKNQRCSNFLILFLLNSQPNKLLIRNGQQGLEARKISYPQTIFAPTKYTKSLQQTCN